MIRPLRDTRPTEPTCDDSREGERVTRIELAIEALKRAMTDREGDAGEDELQQARELLAIALRKAERAHENRDRS